MNVRSDNTDNKIIICEQKRNETAQSMEKSLGVVVAIVP
jgi:hypothetical protein